MSDYLVSPQGSAPFARWECLRCVTRSNWDLTGDQARAEAASHVRAYGHSVRVERGSGELLAGMAVTVSE